MAASYTDDVIAANLNDREAKALDTIVAEGLRRHANLPDRDVEVKSMHISRLTGWLGAPGPVFVVVEVGYVNDETSMLSLFRTRGAFAIGRRGAIKLPTNAREKNPLTNGWVY